MYMTCNVIVYVYIFKNITYKLNKMDTSDTFSVISTREIIFVTSFCFYCF